MGAHLYRTPFPEVDILGKYSMHLYPTAATKSLQRPLSPYACIGDTVTEGGSTGGAPRAPLLKKAQPLRPKAEPIGCVRKNVWAESGVRADEGRELGRESPLRPRPSLPTLPGSFQGGGDGNAQAQLHNSCPAEATALPQALKGPKSLLLLQPFRTFAGGGGAQAQWENSGWG